MKAASLTAWLFAIVLGSPVAGRAVVPITSCGQKVPAGETGVLQNDVECDYRCTGDRSIVCGFDGNGRCGDKGYCAAEDVTLKRDAVLDLNGHTVSAAYQNYAVICLQGASSGRCVVRGPGTLSGGHVGILSTGPDVLVDRVTIDADYDTVVTPGFAEIRRSSLFSGAMDNGVHGGAGVKLVRTESIYGTISSGGDIELARVKLGRGRTYVETPAAVRGHDVVMAGLVWIQGRDVRLRRAKTRRSDVYTWGSAVDADHRVRLVDSDVTFVAAPTVPLLVRSTCEYSYVSDTHATWGLCTSD